MLQSIEFCRYSFTQFVQVSRAVIRQPIVFDIGPHIVYRVQLWGIRWKFLHNQSPVFSEVIRHGLCTVNRDSVPQERDGSPNLVPYIFDEFHHWFCSKVGVICRELKIETEVPPLRANRDCRYHRDASVGLRDFDYGRTTSRCPSSSQQRGKHEPCLIHEDDVSMSLVCSVQY